MIDIEPEVGQWYANRVGKVYKVWMVVWEGTKRSVVILKDENGRKYKVPYSKWRKVDLEPEKNIHKRNSDNEKL